MPSRSSSTPAIDLRIAAGRSASAARSCSSRMPTRPRAAAMASAAGGSPLRQSRTSGATVMSNAPADRSCTRRAMPRIAARSGAISTHSPAAARLNRLTSESVRQVLAARSMRSSTASTARCTSAVVAPATGPPSVTRQTVPIAGPTIVVGGAAADGGAAAAMTDPSVTTSAAACGTTLIAATSGRPPPPRGSRASRHRATRTDPTAR